MMLLKMTTRNGSNGAFVGNSNANSITTPSSRTNLCVDARPYSTTIDSITNFIESTTTSNLIASSRIQTPNTLESEIEKPIITDADDMEQEEKKFSPSSAQIFGPVPIEIPDMIAISPAGSVPNSPTAMITPSGMPVLGRCCNASTSAKPSGIYSPSRRLNGIVPVDRIDEDDVSMFEDANEYGSCMKNENPNGAYSNVPISAITTTSHTITTTKCDIDDEFVDNEESSNSSITSEKRIFPVDPYINITTSNNQENTSPRIFRGRRQTVTSKFPTRINNGKSGLYHDDRPRKTSLAEDFWWHRKMSANGVTTGPTAATYSPDISDDADGPPRQLCGYRRRMSVPEKTIYNADYAILRKNFESQIEIVGAFHRADSDAYRNFLESLTCYDLAPQHGVVVMLDAKLTLHKAVTILCLNAGNRVALINNIENRQNDMGIFTVTDCLHVLKLAATQAKKNATSEKFSEKDLQYFLDEIQQKSTLISVTSNTSVWNVARLFRMNRVHRIPVIEENISVAINADRLCTMRSSEVISFISLRPIFVEILRLCDSKCSLKPNLRILTIKALNVGEWREIATITENETFGQAIHCLLDRKISCLPILSADKNVFTGILTKDDILDAVARFGSNNYAEILETPIKVLIKDDPNGLIYVTPESTIEYAIRLIVSQSARPHTAATTVGAATLTPNAPPYDAYRQERQCVYVLDEKANRCVVGVVSLADIMQFIFNITSNISTTISRNMNDSDENIDEDIVLTTM